MLILMIVNVGLATQAIIPCREVLGGRVTGWVILREIAVFFARLQWVRQSHGPMAEGFHGSEERFEHEKKNE
jgi:hypothetical protein